MNKGMKRPRHDFRRDTTRAALIEAAEVLIAELGVEAVTSRQIGAAIGSANNNVVAYHFGSKEELITEIYHHRLPVIEARRAELLARLDEQGQGGDLIGLLDALWRPLYEQRDKNGKHSYAAFLASIARSGWSSTRYSLGQDYQVVNCIVERVFKLVPEPTQPRLYKRMTTTAAMISTSLAAMNEVADRKEESDQTFYDLLAMTAAALYAPIEPI